MNFTQQLLLFVVYLTACIEDLHAVLRNQEMFSLKWHSTLGNFYSLIKAIKAIPQSNLFSYKMAALFHKNVYFQMVAEKL